MRKLVRLVVQGGFHHYAIVADPTGIDDVDLDSDGNDDNIALYVDGTAVIPDPDQNLHQYGTDVFMSSFHDGSSGAGAFNNGHGVSDELWIFEHTLTQTMIDLLISGNAITDGDGDDVADPHDNCPATFNPNQIDTDDDGAGNLCDPDLGNNGIVGISDLVEFLACFGSMQGQGNYDPDCDFNSDGFVDGEDYAIYIALFGTQVGE